MAKILTCDIETVPQDRYREVPGFEPAPWWVEGRLRAVHAHLVDGHPLGGLRNFEEMVLDGDVPLKGTSALPGLHPTTCHVVQVSFGWLDGDGLKTKVVQSDDYAAEGVVSPELTEPTLLRDAFQVLVGAVQKDSVIVSFNGKAFDLWVLRVRAALLRLEMPWLPWGLLLHPYNDKLHVDLRLVLGNGDKRAHGTLQWWADAFGVHAEEHGAEVAAWVAAGEWGKLRTYGETEAKTLVDLYQLVVR